VAYGFNQGLGLHIMIAGTLAVLVTFCAGPRRTSASGARCASAAPATSR
jgi:hypothetical protein